MTQRTRLFTKNPSALGSSAENPSDTTVPFKSYTICDNSAADLLVQLSKHGHIIHYYVSKQQLAATSSVFRKMVDENSRMPSIRKRKRDDIWCLDLHDDNPEALLVLLRAIHAQMDMIPKSAEYEQMLSLARLCDKYDCARLVSPWADAWMRRLATTISTNKDNWLTELCSQADNKGFETWLYMCVVFGVTGHFRAVTRKLALTLGSRPSNALAEESAEHKAEFWRYGSRWYSDDYVPLAGGYIPDNLLNHICQLREESLERLRSVGEALVKRFEGYYGVNINDTDSEDPHVQGQELCNGECMAITEGVFRRELRKAASGIRTFHSGWKFLQSKGNVDETSGQSLPARDVASSVQICADELVETFDQMIRYTDKVHHEGGPYNLPAIVVCQQFRFLNRLSENVREVLDGIKGCEAEQYFRYHSSPMTWETLELPSTNNDESERSASEDEL